MGSISQEAYFGGSKEIDLTSDRDLGPTALRRFRAIDPDAGGRTLTLKAADSQEIPFGLNVLVFANVSGSFAFTLEDAEATFSKSIAVGKGAFVTKYANAAGQARFVLNMQDLL